MSAALPYLIAAAIMLAIAVTAACAIMHARTRRPDFRDYP